MKTLVGSPEPEPEEPTILTGCWGTVWTVSPQPATFGLNSASVVGVVTMSWAQESDA